MVQAIKEGLNDWGGEASDCDDLAMSWLTYARGCYRKKYGHKLAPAIGWVIVKRPNCHMIVVGQDSKGIWELDPSKPHITRDWLEDRVIKACF
jgi:hypothetical protein